MSFEVELKFPLADPLRIVRALDELHAERGLPVEQRDRYYQHPSRDFAATNEAFRIRQVGDQNRVTYKGPLVDTQAKVRREIEVEFAPGPCTYASMHELLELLGFRPVREVVKTRTPYHLDWEGHSLELAFDEVENLGSFLEIETLAEEETREDARDVILNMAKHLELANPERRSYLVLLLDREAGAH